MYKTPEIPRNGICRRWHPWVSGDRHHFDANVSRQDLQEHYLPAFAAAVETDVAGVMCRSRPGMLTQHGPLGIAIP